MRRYFISLFLLLFAVSCKPESFSSKNSLRLNFCCEPPTLDPRKAVDSVSSNILIMLFEGLTRVGMDDRPHTALAKQIEISPDQKTYTFTLRKAFWSNGAEIIADDILYTWQSILDPNFPSPFAYKFYIIENAEAVKKGMLPKEKLGITVLNSHKFEVRLNHPTPYFLELLASPIFFPISKVVDENNPDWAHQSQTYISNGPFLLEKWEHENEIKVVKNVNYWDAGVVQLDSIHLSMIEDNTTEFYMYEMGEIDWAGSPFSYLPIDLIPALKKEGKIITTQANGVYYYTINVEKFPLNNLSLRKALSLAINRSELIKYILQAGQEPALALIPPMRQWSANTLFSDYNLDEAKKCFKTALAELKIENETLPTLTLAHNVSFEHHKIAQAIQQQWREAFGIQVELEQYDWKVYLSKINKQDYQIGRMSWIGDFSDPISFLEPFKCKNTPELGGINATGWENPHYAILLDEAQKECDENRRKIILHDAEELLIKEMPIIPLFYLVFSYLKKPYVEDVYISPLGWADFKFARCTKQ